MFRAIQVENFAPFGTAQFVFPPVPDKPNDLAEVHLFTGVNGTGKTRLLTVLAALLGNPRLLQTRLGAGQPLADILGSDSLPRPGVGDWRLSLRVSEGESEVRIRSGLYEKSCQVAAFSYRGTAYVCNVRLRGVPSVPRPAREICLNFNRPETESQSLLEAIVNAKFKAAMEAMEAVKPSGSGLTLRDTAAARSDPSTTARNPGRATRMVEAIESTVSSITDRPFSFRVETQPAVALKARWGATELPFDLLADGLRSIIGWMVHAVVMMDAWLEGKADPLQTEAVFLLDEIESHLHPAWQRRILPAFQRLFPKAQIFVATHSPFVIASLNHGWIHPLAIEPGGKVVVKEPVPASQGDSYVSVLEDIMGLKEWYDPETETLLAEFRASRDAAYRGDRQALEQTRQLAARIGSRSLELDYMMGRELSQLDRQLAQTARAK